MQGKRSRTVLTDGPHPVDVHVGSRLRMRRTLMGMSQEKVADLLGLTVQQLQKYEKGANRVSASRLYELSQILGVPPEFFFEEMADGPKSGKLAATAMKNEDQDPLSKRETMELVRAYYRIKDPTVRRNIEATVKAMAG